MSRLMQFVFAAYAPLVARFHLLEASDRAHASASVDNAGETPKCTSRPDRRVANGVRRSTRRSMAA